MFKNNIKIISIIIGTLIGAGFASGKEIYTFFKVINWQNDVSGTRWSHKLNFQNKPLTYT